MNAKTQAEVYLQPKNRAPLKRTAAVSYANAAELRKQIKAYAATVWINAKRIDVDANSREILVNGIPVANYALHIAGEPAPSTPTVPTVPIRNRHAAAATLARHTIAQLAVIIAGLIVTASAGHLNGQYLAGFALAGFGIYRIALGVQRREAIHPPA